MTIQPPLLNSGGFGRALALPRLAANGIVLPRLKRVLDYAPTGLASVCNYFKVVLR